MAWTNSFELSEIEIVRFKYLEIEKEFVERRKRNCNKTL